ncbi:cation channel family protein (macronuclear) [Tetrahymena thermophila SB210]|uniref:Cation channel family protein n=1 Tax=Tetrahymena thermophila (strain SB210) TaxID=312017 RepID=I7MJ16_TETTS|nr:cation channel family protein [Tetrahymena thermophila SB210]EAS04960.2 cation channel family protein [Tetrahymena thermophila SB210]|eukprot:XP_001025205.2 cation channel family protein [Tetrahymena thermophila SB210]
MDNQNYIQANNQMKSKLALNKAQQQEDILQQQQSISEDKLPFKSPQFTRISQEQESQQNDKIASLLQQEYQSDQSYISCAQNQNNQLAQQISDKKSFFITNLPSKTLELSSSIIQVRKGRKTIDRQKRDDSVSEYQNKSKKSKRKDLSNRNSQVEENELIYQQDEVITNQVGTNNEKIWVSKFYKILTFINRFVVRNKQRLIYFHPNQLQSHQAQAINDLAYEFNNEYENKQMMKDNIFRSQYKIVRKLRIMYLIFRKSTKQCYSPFQSLQNKIISLLKNILDPIPVILPYNNFSLGWDLIILILILINVIKIPYELAFNDGYFSVGIVSYISRAIFFLDFFMMFNTAFYENGVLEKQRSKIFLHFLKKRLVIEGCTYVCLWFNPFGIQLFRIFFLIKFLQFYDTIEKLAEAFQLSYKYNFIVKLIVLLIEVVLLCHLFACIWYSIGNYEVKNSTGLNWIQKFSTDNNNQYQQYIDSIYFSVVTIGTIGYGDIVPVSTLEKVCLTAMAIFSCGIFAYILSNIQNVYREYQMKQEGYISKLVKLNNYMFNREVNPNLQQMARKYLEYVHQQGFQQGVMPCDTLNSLSSSLRQEIKEDIFKKSINNIKYLSNFSNQFKIQLSRKMTEINYGPDEFIMKKGQQQQPRLYYILKGQVEVCLDKGLKNGYQENNSSLSLPFSLQKQNDVLGLFEFTSQSQTCMTNARSIGVTTVHVLALDDFLEIINQNSYDKEIYFQQKDKINLYHNYQHVKLFCYSCKSSQHLISDCPLFFYKPNEERVVNKYIKEQNYIKKSIRNKTSQRFNSLAIFNSLKQDIQDFRDQNESEINSMYQSQSTINECSLHNFDINEGLLHQQSNLSPLKPKSEVNLRLIKYRKSQEEDQINEQNDLQNIQVEFKDKVKKIDLIQQEIKQYQSLKTPDEDFNVSSSSNQKQLNHLKTMPEKNVQEIQLLNNFEGKQRKSFNISVVVPKRNSISTNNKLLSNISHESFQTQPLESVLSQINQKQLNENQKYNKDIQHENNKALKSQTSFQNQNKRLKNENNISFAEIQKALNLLATTIVTKDNKNIQDDIQEELITDTIRSYQYYMIHNNAATVIEKLNLLIDKKQEIQRQKILDVFSTSVQYRSICQKI